MTDPLKQLETIFQAHDKLTEGMISSKDFEKIFEAFLNVVKELKGQLETMMSDKHSTAMAECEKIISDITLMENRIVKDIKNIPISEMDSMIKQVINDIKSIKDNMPVMPDLSVYDAKLSQIEASIPVVKDIVLDTPEQIRDKLETLKDDNRLDKSAIKGLKEELKLLEEKISTGGGRISGGFRSNNATQFYDLSTLTDGSTKIFTVPKSKSAIVIGSDFPTILMENNGFTINGTRTQITLTTPVAPSSGSQLLYQYTGIFNIL